MVGSLTLAGLFIFGASYLGKAQSAGHTSLSSLDTRGAISTADGDSDGLPDWEEVVRGTDPKRADTDGDGTADGQEVKLYRDPTKPGPDDSLSTAENDKFIQQLVAAASSTNLTDSISQTLFAQYVGARSKGTSGDTQTQQKLVTDAVSKASVPLSGKTYTESDVRVIGNSDAEIRAFANASITAIKNHPKATFGNAVAALSAAIGGADPSAETKLRIIGGEYRALARELAAIQVPQAYTKTYVKGINTLESAGAAFEDMAHVSDDPVRAVAGLKNYNAMTAIGAEVFAGIARDILKEGLAFSTTESGKEWESFLFSVAL